jgi:hypothetical protein
VLAAYALLVTAALIVLAFLYIQQTDAIRASCRFYGALAAIPAQPTPPQTRPSKLLIVFIAGSRDAFAGQGCGPLPLPGPGLVHWAQVYGIPVRR